MRFLCVSDIHGHAAALQKVIREADQMETWDVLVAAGDHLFPGPAPLDTWKLLLEHKALCVQGVGDRALAAIDPDKLSATDDAGKARVKRLRETHAELGELIIARLSRLPRTVRLPLDNGAEMLVVHGSPRDPTEAMSVEMSDDELIQFVADDPADVVLCGASHVAFERNLDDQLIVNVGSVGEAPSGEHADASFVETGPEGVIVKQFTVAL